MSPFRPFEPVKRPEPPPGRRWAEGVIPRASTRKAWPCWGNGAGKAARRHAEGCTGTIEAGEPCIEYVGESLPFEAGPHVSLACAARWYVE